MTALETNLLNLAKTSQDESFNGLIYSGGFLYATNKKVLVRTHFEYPKSSEGKILRVDGKFSDLDSYSIYKVRECASQYEKGRGRDNVEISVLRTMLSFADVYNRYAKDKIEYIRINEALYNPSSLTFMTSYAEYFGLFMAGTSRIKDNRVLISRDSENVILNSEFRPEGADFAYIDYKNASLVFAEMNIPKLKSVITKKLDKAKADNKPQAKIKEFQKDLSIINEFTAIGH